MNLRFPLPADITIQALKYFGQILPDIELIGIRPIPVYLSFDGDSVLESKGFVGSARDTAMLTIARNIGWLGRGEDEHDSIKGQ